MTCVTNRPPNSAITARIPTSEAIITSPVARVRRRPRATSHRISGSIASARNHEITTMKMTLPSRDSARHVASPRKTANPVIRSARGSHAGGLRGSRVATRTGRVAGLFGIGVPRAGRRAGSRAAFVSVARYPSPRHATVIPRRVRCAAASRALSSATAMLGRSQHVRHVGRAFRGREQAVAPQAARNRSEAAGRRPGRVGGHTRHGRRRGDTGHRVALRDPPRRSRTTRGRRTRSRLRRTRTTRPRSRPARRTTPRRSRRASRSRSPRPRRREDRAVLLARLQLLETENARLRATATVPPPAAAGTASAAQGGPLDRRGGPHPDRRPARARSRSWAAGRAGWSSTPTATSTPWRRSPRTRWCSRRWRTGSRSRSSTR